jgi:signal transduction histidine kinase
VRVAATQEPAGLCLEVRDTGVGLSPESQARVFDRFFKQDASRSRGGTGLGLSIVRAIAEAHGGTASVSSEPGRGSTFRIVIPQ